MPAANKNIGKRLYRIWNGGITPRLISAFITNEAPDWFYFRQTKLFKDCHSVVHKSVACFTPKDAWAAHIKALEQQKQSELDMAAYYQRQIDAATKKLKKAKG